jgi:3-deoxy-7-phosphoheptulonate synthase
MTGLPSPAFLRQQYPASSASIVRGRRAIEAIGAGIDSRLLIILGPCSLHDEESSYEYAAQVKSLAQEVQEHCLLVMRTFLEKPRTGKGWTGLLYDPHMNGSYDIAQGLLLARKILTTIVDMDLPIAYEFLDPLAAPYLEDLVTFGIIGARTSSSPVHRQLVSGLAMPCGFKNCLDGNWHQAINSIAVAAEPITRLTIDQDGQIIQKETSGNQNSYLILRGGYRRVNCDPTSIEQALLDLEKADRNISLDH